MVLIPTVERIGDGRGNQQRHVVESLNQAIGLTRSLNEASSLLVELSAREIPAVAGASTGSLLARSGASTVLATNATAGLRAREVVIEDIDSGHRVTSIRGARINLPGHGFTLGADLWLSTSGGKTETEPSGASVHVVQRVGFVDDANNIIFTFETPRYEK